jgi:hypothetical protein
MKGFKDSTRVQYITDDHYAMGGKVGPKGAAKISKVMGEFKRGELHSGKDGPKVTNPQQAKAIAMSEARRNPMKKASGGAVKGGGMGQMSEREMAKLKLAKMRAESEKGGALGAVTEREANMMAKRKGVPAHSSAPMIKKAYGGKVKSC